MTHLSPIRSVLFAPANRADLIAKLPRSQPDAVVIDLEDAVPDSQDAKAEARIIAKDSIQELIAKQSQQGSSCAVFLRINSPHSPYFDDDLALLSAELTGVMVPKIESGADSEHMSNTLRQIDLDIPIFAGLETAAGVWNALEILQNDSVQWGYFGAEDYTTDLGGKRRVDNLEVLYARSRVALAARMAGISAFDIVVPNFGDAAIFNADAEQGRALGYAGKLCIHPAQVALTHQHFGATKVEKERAQRLLQAATEAAANGLGAFAFEGQMVDGPMLAKAKAALAKTEVES